jgi:outer membrane protein OmpA-like peptidoglycan-associated protein
MGFDYNRQKEKHGSESMWTSYSDLFLGLSIIFLLLYVSANLKQGTDGVRQAIENKRLVQEAEDLKQQIKVYETLKQDYLAKQAAPEEQANYEELMGKLDLLQDQADQEKKDLRKQAQENENKEHALNKYQQMIRNIINSNLIAKSRIKSRDNMIDTKDEVITEKSTEISGLQQTVASKSAEVQARQAQVASLESQVQTRLKQLRNAYKLQKISKVKFEKQQKAIQADANLKLQSLRGQEQKVREELARASAELQQTSSKLANAENAVGKLGQEKSKLEGELSGIEAKHQAELAKMKSDAEADNQRRHAAFEAALAKERLSGEEKAAREAAFKAQADKRASELAGQMASLDKKYQESQGQLAKANENLNAKRKLAEKIKGAFAANGVSADVDLQNGDVMLSFGDHYFDTGQANLKPQMKKILEKAMPAYSASLFNDPKIASKIQSVEIVGFASPTYKGKYVDPKNMDPESRQAVNYNLDLSYNRARSIFNYIFDKDKMEFQHQKQLLPLVKVTGRSFLADDKSRAPAGDGKGAEHFCQVNDCAKLQRVIIKFSLKD